MASFNKVTLLGNLGTDPEIRNFENGGMVASFRLATTESYFDREKNQRVDLPTDWHNVVIKKTGLAKVAQSYLRKGSQVFVEGKLRNRSYQTKEGETRWITEVIVDELVLTGKAGDSKPVNSNEPVMQHSGEPREHHPLPPDTDDLPF